jgi:hypothetical protein
MDRTFLVDLELSIEFFNSKSEEITVELMFAGTYKYWPAASDSPEDHQIDLDIDEDSLILVKSLFERNFSPLNLENDSLNAVLDYLERMAVEQFLSDPSSYLGTW